MVLSISSARLGATGLFHKLKDHQPHPVLLELKAMCPRGDGSIDLEFVVQNQNTDTSFDLDDDDCSERLNNEIFGCDHGGESVVAGWYFR